jgi:hypothetical protein
MNLVSAIEAFNKECQPGIDLLVTRDGRTVAKLPRVGKEIVVKGTALNPGIQVTPHDIGLLCEEARRASAPGLALLASGLAELASPPAIS